MTDPHEFYLQNVDGKELSEIEEKISYEYNKLQKLKAPIMDKTLCLAPFDGGYFRAQILRKSKDNCYDVQFVDYGNKDTFSVNDLYKIPPSVSYYKHQAMKCSLAYVDCPPRYSSLFNNALDICYKMCWDKKIVAHVVFKDADYNYVILSPASKPDIQDS